MAKTGAPADTQLSFLVGGLVLIAGLLTIATLAATELWLSLVAGVLLLVVGLVGLRRGVSRLLAGITLAFAMVVLAAAVFQWSAQVTSAEAEPDVVPSPGPTLISGTVSDAGSPLAGVPVEVTLWPSREDYEVGERIDSVGIKRVRTDAQGRYVVTLALEAVPPKYLMSGRVLNFQVGLTDPFIGPISTSARYSRGAGAWVDVFGDRHSEPKTLDFDLGTMKATESTDGSTQRWPIFELQLDSARPSPPGNP